MTDEVVEISEWVDNVHLQHYHAVMVHCGGRYVRNPFYMQDRVYVHLTIPVEDYQKFSNSVMLFKTHINEIDRRTWYKRMYNRFVSFCKRYWK